MTIQNGLESEKGAGSKVVESIATARDDKLPGGKKNLKAQALTKRKRGATSKTGKGTGKMKSDSSHQMIYSFFSRTARPVEVRNSPGSSIMFTIPSST